MKELLVLAHDDVGQEARVQVALDLARGLDAHLTFLDVVVPPPPYVDYSVGRAIGDDLLEAGAKLEAANRARLEPRLRNEDVAWEWLDRVDSLAGAMIATSALSDLIILNRQLEDYPETDMRAVAGEVVISSERPVLAVPQHIRRFSAERTAIAWDGSPSAIRALRAAVPLMALAGHVLLVEIGAGASSHSATEAARYLSRHNIHARLEHCEALPSGIARTLIAEAGRHGAGLIVAGAYGHSRVREALLGGVTRELLTHSPYPLLLSH
jgi:nucleotide-binding universal stress UspA family protein